MMSSGNNRPGLEWVLCDLGKVLVDFDHGRAASRLESLFAAREIPQCPSRAELHAFFFECAGGGHSRAGRMDRGLASLLEILSEFNARFGAGLSPRDFFPIWACIFGGTNAAMLAAMARFRRQGGCVALCSDTNAAHWEYLVAHYPEVQGMWDAELLSFRIGKIKSDEGFFHDALGMLETSPRATVLIDDRQDNIDAARRAGLHAILFTGQVPCGFLFPA